MTLILNNDEIETVFTLEDCFDVLEPALRDLGNGSAVSMPRHDLLVPGPLDGSYHGLKTSCASLPRSGVTTMRLTSDILTWPIVSGRQRRVKVPLAVGSKYVGLVFVFSTTTGELLAILPDGFIQAIRVGVTNALSAKYMARPDSSVLAVYGSGWQARPAVLAMCKVFAIGEIRVFSPTKSNCERFVAEMRQLVNAKLIAISSAQEAAKNADIVSLATNALDPFFPASWLQPGMHLTTVRPAKLLSSSRCKDRRAQFRNSAKVTTAARSWRKPPRIGATKQSFQK